MTVGLGHDERRNATVVFVRTSTGAWQSVCDEQGQSINFRREARQSRRDADAVVQGFVRAEQVFSGWWERPCP